MEGHLLKYSSGTLTSRWQKRLFVLRETHLEYFGPDGGLPVRFPVKRIRGVEILDKLSRDFQLHIGSSRKYQVRAETAQMCRQWVNAIETVMAKYLSNDDLPESSYKTGGDDSSEKDRSLDDNNIVIDDISIICVPTHNYEEIDAMFSTWFVFLEDPRFELKAGPLIDAATRVVSDLWAILASLPRGEYLVLSGSTLQRVQNRVDGNSAIVDAYLMRLCARFEAWLSRSVTKLHAEEIPVLIEWVSRLVKEIDSIGANTSLLKSLIARLGSEWEVALIERIQAAMEPCNIWDYPPTVVVGGESHGPSRVVSPSVGSVVIANKSPVLITSWVRRFFSAINEYCLSRSTKGTCWTLAYPTCIDILASHCANALIASMNSAWREFKTRVNLYSSRKPLFKRLSPKKKIPLATNYENMLAFGNEATLISVFCQHVSAVTDMRNSLPLFAICMEGLSLAFANTAKEVSKQIIKMHFLKRFEKKLHACFDPKSLSVRVQIPIFDSLEIASQFIQALPQNGTHDLLRYLLVGQVMHAVSNAYIDSLVSHQPKISKFTRLAAVVAEDEGLFFSTFRDLGRPPIEINGAIECISQVRSILSDTDDTPPSQGGIALVKLCTELAKVVVPFERAVVIVKALLHIKSINKADRKDVIDAVYECIHRTTESPADIL